MSALGFAGYLVAQHAWSVTLAALLANVGITAFWTASGSLVALAADEGERSRWFGLIRALRNFLRRAAPQSRRRTNLAFGPTCLFGPDMSGQPSSATNSSEVITFENIG